MRGGFRALWDREKEPTVQHHRFANQTERYHLPSLLAPAFAPGSFIACPLALCQGLTVAQLLGQAAVYQLAFEQAQATLRPSLPERDLLAVWN
jgi:hypothetical protein